MSVYSDPFNGSAPIDAVVAPPLCSRCGAEDLRRDTISTAFWGYGGLVVIESIPVLVCTDCGEDHIAEGTAVALDHMRTTGFDLARSDRVMEVPVFHFTGPHAE